MKQDSTQEQIKKLLLEAKDYYGCQKEFLKLTIAEQLTHILGAIIVTLVCIMLAMAIITFLGLALVHWIGNLIGNIAICYAVFSLIMISILAVFYNYRRKWVYLRLARLLTHIFVNNDSSDSLHANNDEKTK